MDYNKLSALKRCYATLVQSLDTIEILDYLISGECISHDEFEKISAKATSTEKARALLDILFRKSNEAFNCFQSALSEKQPYLAKILKDQLTKVPNPK